MSLKPTSTFCFALLLLAGVAASAAAQTATVRFPRASQKASVMQTIGVTDVTITYHRPAVKGRRIWGDPLPAQADVKGEATLDNQNLRPKEAAIVPWGHVWRAGANDATVFEVTDDVLINGEKLPAGKYSLHTIPTKDEWTIIFNSDPGQWGSFTYSAAKDTLRVKTKPQAADNQEWLAFTFDPITENSATVNLRWEKLRVPFTVEVKDVVSAWRKRADELIAANPTNESLPLQVAGTYFQRKSNDEALKFIDQSIKLKETWGNLNLKARILWAMGKKDEAIAQGDAAVAKGKELKANTAAFEKTLAEWKTPKTQ